MKANNPQSDTGERQPVGHSHASSSFALSKLSGWMLAVVPLTLTIALLSYLPEVAGGKVFKLSLNWIPSLGINLNFYLDGLSLFFAILISGIGVLVLIYGAGYLHGDKQLPRFYLFLMLFMFSMLGLVLSDNLITLFVFWELTSVTSYLLIGYHHQRDESRRAALTALLVTGIGGLALLAGLLLLAQVGGYDDLSALLSESEAIKQHHLYVPILLLLLLGAFTKSAQMPFHFWLPGAMAAPTPVSAYLHSATMVKAGIYLLARLNPLLGGTDEWHYLVTLAGGVTMLGGGLMALPQTDAKRLLAYSTVSALGALVLLLGLSTELATKAALVFLLVHSLYKGALFMIAGAVDHAAGTRDVRKLYGLRKSMPITALAAALAALSMSGFPPLLGFISKELLYEAKMQAPQAGWFILLAGVTANMANVAVAAIIGIRPFLGRPSEETAKAHETDPALWIGALVMASLGLLFGLFPALISETLIEPAILAVRAEETVVVLKLWHGLNPVLLLSFLTVLGGAGLFLARRVLRKMAAKAKILNRISPSRLFQDGLAGVLAFAGKQTRILQNGYQRYYLLTILAVAAVLVCYKLIVLEGLDRIPPFVGLQLYEAGLVILMMAAAAMAVVTSSRLAAVAALGVVGIGVSLIFVMYGAPDLAITQILIETLTVILFVLVVYRLPEFAKLSSKRSRWRDLGFALGFGMIMTALVLKALSLQFYPSISGYFSENSLSAAKGRNIVNVILVDFRAMDTLGEITVLAVAAIGVVALLKLMPLRKGR